MLRLAARRAAGVRSLPRGLAAAEKIRQAADALLRLSPPRPAQVAAPRPIPALFTRGMAGAVKVYDCDQEEVYGPATVPRTEAKIEMGVRYEAGVPSPMEGAHFNPPIVVDGLVAKTGGDGLGSPVQFIKLSRWCARGVAPGHGVRRRLALPVPRLRCAQGSLLLRVRVRSVASQGSHTRGVQVHGGHVRVEAGARLCGENEGQVERRTMSAYIRLPGVPQRRRAARGVY